MILIFNIIKTIGRFGLIICCLFVNTPGSCQDFTYSSENSPFLKIPFVWEQEHPDYTAGQLTYLISLRSSIHNLPETKEDWETLEEVLYQEAIRRNHVLTGQTLPLDMQIKGSMKKEGFTVQNVIFQTRPGIYATANLYIPDGKGKFPAVLLMMGHSFNGRFYFRYQYVAISLALQGYVVLAIDPWGAGERTTTHGQFEDHGDENNLGSCLLDLGETLMGMQLTDNIRALDLLCSLPFVDPQRIGATGSSGGGNQSIWLAALDERIKAAVPVVSAGTFEAYKLGSPCICEVFPAGLNLTEEAGILAMIAPRALLLINHSKDHNPAFNPKGMLTSYHKAKPVYRLLSAENNIAYRIFDLPHGYYPEDREAMLGWFDMHLKGTGNGEPVKMPEPDTIPYLQLMAFPPGKRDPLVMNTETYCKLKGKELRKVFLENNIIDTAARISGLCDILGVSSRNQLARVYEYAGKDGWKRLALETADAKMLPVLMRLPERSANDFFVICNTDSMMKTSLELIERYISQGKGIVLADLTGIGENGSRLSHQNDIKYGDFRTLTRSDYWLGKTPVGEWVNDLDVVIQYLKSDCHAGTITVDGTREAGLAALFMTAIWHNTDGLILRETPLSYLFDTRENIDFYSMAVHIPGILKWGDVSLAAALTGNNITFVNPLTLSGREIPEEELSVFKVEFAEMRKRCGTKGEVKLGE
jgi:hypothetical protein